MPLNPEYANLTANNTAPAEGATLLTPSDGADLAVIPTRGLYIGTSGNLNVDMADGTTVLFSNVPVGVLPIRVKRVRSTNTTALLIIALY